MQRTQVLRHTCSQMLEALQNWLGKAKEQGDLEDYLTKRLAPDMYPLSSQVCFACFLVQEAICRLSGKEIPEEALEIRRRGWSVDEQTVEVSDLLLMISETRDQLASLEDAELDQAGDAAIIFSLPDGMTFEMRPDEFMQDWTMPQFYFHICTAYAIMRNNSVPLGKVDYVAHMLRYVRG